LPDALVIAMMLTFGVAAAGWLSGVSSTTLVQGWVDGYHAPGAARAVGGLWSLHTFAMQMCLILVTGTLLAGTPPIRRVLVALADRVSGPRSGVALVALLTMALSLCNWGLGLIAGAILAREVARSCARRGIPAYPPTLAAAGYSGLAVWHGGLSGSAPLKVTTVQGLAEVLGPELAATLGPISLWETTLSPRNLVVTAVAVVVAAGVLVWLTPKAPAVPNSQDLAGEQELPPAPGFAGWLESSPALPLGLAAMAAAWLVPFMAEGGLTRLDPDVLNLLFLTAGLALVGSSRRLIELATEGATHCGGILVQFPLYGGILGLLAAGGWLAPLSDVLPHDPRGLAVATYLSAGALNLLIPSGGGQWAVQGPIVMQAAADAGVSPARVVLALAYGDQWTNLIQPFWAVPLLGITGVRLGELLAPCMVLALALGVVFGVGIALG
jgi:short-chain fatty acids transporter